MIRATELQKIGDCHLILEDWEKLNYVQVTSPTLNDEFFHFDIIRKNVPNEETENKQHRRLEDIPEVGLKRLPRLELQYPNHFL